MNKKMMINLIGQKLNILIRINLILIIIFTIIKQKKMKKFYN
jgi:hypothetical protein